MKLVPRFLAALALCAAPALALERPGPDPESPPLPPGLSTTVEGTVQALYADDFDGGHSELLYHLVTDEGTRLPLAFSETAPAYRTGERLRVTGRMSEGGRFEVDRTEPAFGHVAESAGTSPTTLTIGAKRVLLIRYNFANDTSQPYSDAAAQAVMFAATGSTAAFYAQGSYGLTTHTGSITPWLTVSTNKPTTCDLASSNQASTLASAAGYNPGTYNYVVYVFPHIPCGWSGLGVVGGSGAWINQALSTYVVAHEVGHNYGLWHSHSWDCGVVPLGPTCSRSEYGDPFDTMGGNLYQFNAYSKAAELGWLTGSSVAHISSGSGTFTLSPLESTSGVRALQVGSPTGKSFWVEFRQGIGFDAGLASNANVMNGALIHYGPSDVGGTDLLDMTAGTSTFSDAALDVGGAFTDPATGITITTLSKNGSTLTVKADFQPVMPTASFNFSPANPNPGQSVQFTDTSSGPPTQWSWTFGDGITSTLQNPTHTYSAPGLYTATLTARNGVGTSAAVSLTVPVAIPIISTLAASPAPPRPTGTAMAWTATATGGVAPLQYCFWSYTASTGWTLAQAYSTSNTFAWTPWQAGQFDIAVWVKSAGSPNAYDAVKDTGYFNITAGVTISNLTASPAPPRAAGTPMTWTATASGTPAPLQYKFWRYDAANGWVMVRDYATTNTFAWTPSQAGSYDIAVWVRANGSPNAYDAVRDTGMFTITSNVTVSALTGSPAPPRPAGTAITWTATASGSPAPLQYRFWQYTASGGWVMVRDYATTSSFIWTPPAAGQYDVAVWVKSATSPNAFDVVRDSGFFNITP